MYRVHSPRWTRQDRRAFFEAQSPSENSVQLLRRWISAAAGCRFFRILFFAQAKKSIPSIGQAVAIATQNQRLFFAGSKGLAENSGLNHCY